MDFIDVERVACSGSVCAGCGGSISTQLSNEFRLCEDCIEKRRSLEEALRVRVRRSFNLRRSPGIRSCFLKLLLSQSVELEPSGWKRSIALGYELKKAGFNAKESGDILLQAGGKAERVSKLLESVYGNKWTSSLKCSQIKSLSIICENCPRQFCEELKETITEISEGPSLP
jgi:hypothetical protein